MKTTNKIWLATGLTMALAVGGCGSGDDGNENDSALFVPDSAGQSSDSIVDFILSLSQNDETSEPLMIRDQFAVPPDETNPPRPLT